MGFVMKNVDLVYPLVGKVIGKKDEYVEIFEMSQVEMERLLREIAKFDYKFKQSDDLVTVEFHYQDKALFVECSFASYKRLCDIYFKNKIALVQEEKELN